MRINWDGLGIVTSIACAVHCAVLPLIVTTLPMFGINIIHNMLFEWTMICIAFVVGSYALVHGYVKHHRSVWPLLLFTAGFSLLIIKQFMPQHEIYLLIPAVAGIVSAHYINFRYCHRHEKVKGER